MKNLLIFIIVLFSACRLGSSDNKQALIAETVEKVDIEKTGFVIDEVGLLDDAQIVELNSNLQRYYYTSGIEILCIITSSFQVFGSEQNYTDYFLYNYDREVNKTLVLVVLFSEDRRVYIRTNKKSDQYYPAERRKQVIDLYMLPSFKKGDFFEGFQKGIKELTVTDNV